MSRHFYHPYLLTLAAICAFSACAAKSTAQDQPAQDQPAPAAAQEDPAAVKKLASELSKAGRRDEAIIQYKKVYDLEPTLENGIAWAKSLLAVERYNDTLSAAESMLDKFKSDPGLHIFIAEACEARALARTRDGADKVTIAAEYEAAARAIEDALLLKPGDPELYCSLIRFLLFATKYEEAVEVAEKARKTSPNHWKVAMMHADALYWEASAAGLIHLSKDAGDAEKKEREAKITLVTSIYAESAKLGPGQAEPRQRLGAFLLQTGGDKDKAIAEYVAAISKNPASADVSAVLPVLSPKELLDLFTKAQSEFNKNHPKVADADPADVMIWWYLGYAKYLSDDRKGATEAFQRVITKTPSDMTARYYLGRILALDQKWKDAAAQFETIAKKSPKALADLGRSDTFFVPTVQLLVSKLLVPDDAAGPVTGLADGPELRTAILFTRAILELQPNNIVEWNNIGLFYRDSGNGKEALYAYKKALELNPTDPRLLNDTAVVYHYSLPQSKENDEEIKRLYERSIARAKEVIADKRSGAIEKENAQSALKDATGNLARFLRGDRRNN